MPAPDGVGPPGPEMRSPSWELGRREVSNERATIGTYPAPAQLSVLVRLACAALRAEEFSPEWLACRRISPRKEATCR
jgi:hypothetical protein